MSKNTLKLVYKDRDNVEHVVESVEDMLMPAFRNEFIIGWWNGKPHTAMKQRITAI